MINELRGISINKVLKENLLENEIIGVGSEGCVHELCVKAEEMIEYKNAFEKVENFHIRIITPRIPEEYMNKVVGYIEKLFTCFKVNSIIINDYGLLHRISKMNSFEIPIILGRTLIRTLSYVPWHSYILRGESEEKKSNLLQPNILHLEKLELYKKYNVAGVELCATTNNIDTIKVLKENSIMTFVNFDNIIATIGRTCPVARMLNEEVKQCKQLCRSALNVEFVKSQGIINTAKYETKISDEIVPRFLNLGSVVYHKKCIDKEFPYELSDGVIFDYRLSDENEIYKKRMDLVNVNQC